MTTVVTFPDRRHERIQRIVATFSASEIRTALRVADTVSTPSRLTARSPLAVAAFEAAMKEKVLAIAKVLERPDLLQLGARDCDSLITCLNEKTGDIDAPIRAS